MGLDVGDRTIGVALTDALGYTAYGLEVIHRKNLDQDIGYLKELVKKYEVEKIIVGLPINLNGTVGPQAEKVIYFADILKENFSLPIILYDERLTTVAAHKTLRQADVKPSKRKGIIDKVAAVFILQAYLLSLNKEKNDNFL